MSKFKTVIIICLISLCFTAFDVEHNDGDVLFKKMKYHDSLEAYKRLLEKKPNDYVLIYNIANNLYKLTEYEESIKHYRQIIEMNNISDDMREKVYFNSGNAYYMLAKYDESLAEFKKAILLNKNNLEAKNNYEIILNIINGKVRQENVVFNNPKLIKKQIKSDNLKRKRTFRKFEVENNSNSLLKNDNKINDVNGIANYNNDKLPIKKAWEKKQSVYSSPTKSSDLKGKWKKIYKTTKVPELSMHEFKKKMMYRTDEILQSANLKNKEIHDPGDASNQTADEAMVQGDADLKEEESGIERLSLQKEIMESQESVSNEISRYDKNDIKAISSDKIIDEMQTSELISKEKSDGSLFNKKKELESAIENLETDLKSKSDVAKESDAAENNQSKLKTDKKNSTPQDNLSQTMNEVSIREQTKESIENELQTLKNDLNEINAELQKQKAIKEKSNYDYTIAKDKGSIEKSLTEKCITEEYSENLEQITNKFKKGELTDEEYFKIKLELDIKRQLDIDELRADQYAERMKSSQINKQQRSSNAKIQKEIEETYSKLQSDLNKIIADESNKQSEQQPEDYNKKIENLMQKAEKEALMIHHKIQKSVVDEAIKNEINDDKLDNYSKQIESIDEKRSDPLSYHQDDLNKIESLNEYKNKLQEKMNKLRQNMQVNNDDLTQDKIDKQDDVTKLNKIKNDLIELQQMENDYLDKMQKTKSRMKQNENDIMDIPKQDISRKAELEIKKKGLQKDVRKLDKTYMEKVNEFFQQKEMVSDQSDQGANDSLQKVKALTNTLKQHILEKSYELHNAHSDFKDRLTEIQSYVTKNSIELEENDRGMSNDTLDKLKLNNKLCEAGIEKASSLPEKQNESYNQIASKNLENIRRELKEYEENIKKKNEQDNKKAADQIIENIAMVKKEINKSMTEYENEMRSAEKQLVDKMNNADEYENYKLNELKHSSNMFTEKLEEYNIEPKNEKMNETKDINDILKLLNTKLENMSESQKYAEHSIQKIEQLNKLNIKPETKVEMENQMRKVEEAMDVIKAEYKMVTSLENQLDQAMKDIQMTDEEKNAFNDKINDLKDTFSDLEKDLAINEKTLATEKKDMHQDKESHKINGEDVEEKQENHIDNDKNANGNANANANANNKSGNIKLSIKDKEYKFDDKKQVNVEKVGNTEKIDNGAGVVHFAKSNKNQNTITKEEALKILNAIKQQEKNSKHFRSAKNTVLMEQEAGVKDW